MRASSISHESKAITNIIEWGVLYRPRQKRLRKHLGDAIAVAIEKLKKWGYLTDTIPTNKLQPTNYYNRVDFLITVLPNLKQLWIKLFKST